MDLRNKIILVTGGAGHLGAAISRKILKLNAFVIIASRNHVRFKSFQKTLSKTHQNKIFFFKTNLLNEKDIILLSKKIKKNFKYINGIVNNASLEKSGSLASVNKNTFLNSSLINLYAPFLIIRELEDLLIQGAKKFKTTSSVVNISSMYGIVSPDKKIYKKSKYVNPIQYGTNKAGMIQMSRYLACNLKTNLIRVNSISPGAFPNKTDNLKKNLMLKSKIPLMRFGSPEEVSGPVAFLLSNESSYIHGSNLVVDGGWTAW